MVAMMPRAVAALLHIVDSRQYSLSYVASRGLKNAEYVGNHHETSKSRINYFLKKIYIYNKKHIYTYVVRSTFVVIQPTRADGVIQYLGAGRGHV